PVHFGLPKDGIKIGNINGQNNGQKIGGGLGINLPGKNNNGPANTGINGGGKIVTLPAPNGNNGPANSGVNGGKITTMPVNGNANTGIKGGRIGWNKDNKVDVKTSMPVNRVTNLPSRSRQQQFNNGQVLKFNNNRPSGAKFNQGNVQSGKMNFGGNNGGSRMVMGGNQMRRF
ncbi:MAG: hypothetical protein KIT82_18775, partial [Bradyrhizobium sp.]|nr:hypothetical protein [Bradyrhizobium sp.]